MFLLLGIDLAAVEVPADIAYDGHHGGQEVARDHRLGLVKSVEVGRGGVYHESFADVRGWVEILAQRWREVDTG